MRKRQTFLLTILSSETGDASFCGRLKVISTGKSTTFTNLEDLNALISQEMEDEVLQQLDGLSLEKKFTQEIISSS